MTNLYVYYSLIGRTQRHIEQLTADDPQAVVVRLEPLNQAHIPVHPLRLMIWNLGALIGWRWPLQPIEVPDIEYETLVIGTPSWMSHPAGPVMTFLHRDLPQLRYQSASYCISCRVSWKGTVQILERFTGQRMQGHVYPYAGRGLASLRAALKDLMGSREEIN